MDIDFFLRILNIDSTSGREVELADMLAAELAGEGRTVETFDVGDAPQLSCFRHKILCGPGSIHVAHRSEEHILLKDIECAIDNYVRAYSMIMSKK